MPPSAQKKPRRGLGGDKSKREHVVTNGKSNGTLIPIGKDLKISADTRIQVSKVAGDKGAPAEELISTQRQPKAAVLIPLFHEIEPVRYCDLKDIKNFIRRSERILDRADATALSSGTQTVRVRDTPPRQAAQRANERRKAAQRMLAAKDEAVFAGNLKRSSSTSSSEATGRRASRKLKFDGEDGENDDDSEGSEEETVLPQRKQVAAKSSGDENKGRLTRSGRRPLHITSLKETHAKARRRLLGKGKQTQIKRKVATEDESEEATDDQESSAESSDVASSPSEEIDEDVSSASEASSNASDQESELSEEELEEASDSSSEEEEKKPRRTARRRETVSSIHDGSSEEQEEREHDDEDEEEQRAQKKNRKGGKESMKRQKLSTDEGEDSGDEGVGGVREASGTVRHRVSESFESSVSKRAKTIQMHSPDNGKRRTTTKGPVARKRTPQKKAAIVLLLSGFEQDRKAELQSWAENVGMRVTDDVLDPSCSHVVVPQPRRHVKCPRTLKVLVGLAKGLPIMSELWITECKRKSRPCSAAPYELNEHFPGVQQRRNRHGKGLLHGLNIFVMRGTMPDPDQMALLVGMADGTVAKSLKSCDLCIGPEQSFRNVRRTGVRFMADSSFLDALQIGELPAADALEL